MATRAQAATQERTEAQLGGVGRPVLYAVALLLCLVFVIPFFGLLSRHVKRNRTGITVGAIWILCVIYLDMYWLVMPNAGAEGELPLSLIDFTAWIGMAGAIAATFAYAAKNVNLMPLKDPRLPRSLAFENI